MMRRSLSLLILLLVLSGCWTGDAWFAASEGVGVIPDGVYRLGERGAPPEGADRIQIKRQPDSSLLVMGPENPWRAIIVPLHPGDEEQFLVQLQEQDLHRPTHALFVMLNLADGHYRVSVLRCRGAAQAVVKGSGGFVTSDPQSGATCVFADRETLLTQLRAAEGTAPAFDLELIREGK